MITYNTKSHKFKAHQRRGKWHNLYLFINKFVFSLLILLLYMFGEREGLGVIK